MTDKDFVRDISKQTEANGIASHRITKHQHS
ncbi:hypothetical protein Pan97_14570 [Bremerella volcania]|uniref:Uncharacterized protein n=1 Tax=Bremerella volcania TaxID=2527984 RepID=A0A518C5F0_9BACT|nr:hypothetical protein Pan97_14570 [Bremerella volcania]